VQPVASSAQVADDTLVVAALRRGDESVFTELVNAYSSPLLRLAQDFVRTRSVAEEVVQETWLAVLNGIDRFEGRSALGTWLYRIAANAALGKQRGKRVTSEVHLEDLLPTFHADGHRQGDSAALLADWSGTPESELLSGEAREILQHALEYLPAHYRAVLVLRDVEELTNEEAAQILGESVASIKSRLHRARMALREQLTRHLAPTLH